MSVRAYEIIGVEWFEAPDRVEPGEPFDLVVRVFGDAEQETQGEPITVTINGEELFTTTGADIPEGDFAFDGRSEVVIEDEGVYALRAEVGGFQTDQHVIGVGQDPDESEVNGGLSPAVVVGGLAALEAARRIFT